MLQTGKEIKKVVVIGAGIGGLTAAAALARAGVDVTVLEAHVYPGGCAGTFFHQGYYFDAGATLAGGFYPGGPMDIVARLAGVDTWRSRPADLAMTVHLPGGVQVNRYSDDRRNHEYGSISGPRANNFWLWQEQTAEAVWRLALRSPDWPPQTLAQARSLTKDGFSWLFKDIQLRDIPGLLRDAFRPVSSHLVDAPDQLRQLIDAQLLISAQTTSRHANALYGAAALDLPRRGVVHLEGGIGGIAHALVQSIRRSGGQVIFRHEVARIVTEKNRPVAVVSKRGETIDADLIIANLTPWNITELVKPNSIRKFRSLSQPPQDAWGAFVVYIGIDGTVVDKQSALHHQVVVREPLGEGNSIFISISPEWDSGRAPAAQRAITLSTHTELRTWWKLYQTDKEAYENHVDTYTQRVLDAAETALPGIRDAARLILPGTPVTFQRFTRRKLGWVGGFPQTNLFSTLGPRLSKTIWMVGDSIFPGQSTAAVALGGLRVAANVLPELNTEFMHIPGSSRSVNDFGSTIARESE